MFGILWTAHTHFSHCSIVSEGSYVSWHADMLMCTRTSEPYYEHHRHQRHQGLPVLELRLHSQHTHLFLCPAISASPWLQKVDVTVESVVGKGFWSIFSVVIWLLRWKKKRLSHILVCLWWKLSQRYHVLRINSFQKFFIYLKGLQRDRQRKRESFRAGAVV